MSAWVAMTSPNISGMEGITTMATTTTSQMRTRGDIGICRRSDIFTHCRWCLAIPPIWSITTTLVRGAKASTKTLIQSTASWIGYMVTFSGWSSLVFTCKRAPAVRIWGAMSTLSTSRTTMRGSVTTDLGRSRRAVASGMLFMVVILQLLYMMHKHH